MNETGNILGVIMIVVLLLTMIFHLTFSRITVRKLRKNKDTKDSLGDEFISGWDTLNVAGAFCRTKWLEKRIMASPTANYAADIKVLYQHTNLFDRILARIFWGFFVINSLVIFLFVVGNILGLFDLL